MTVRSLSCLVAVAFLAASSTTFADESVAAVRTQIAKIAKTKASVFEDTKKLHNEKLTGVFQQFLKQRQGAPTAQDIRTFHALLKEQGLTSFDDFLEAETTPLKYVRDPASGAQVPIFGPLGSDMINPWLGALELIDGKPLDDQPIYLLAANALREHIDFAVVGVADPNLSLARLPDKLRQNAELAYRRLNPTNKFNGGFDHPLYYAVIREAAKKLFRVDYPKAKITMADLVAPEKAGGFGVRSCLLCHDQSHEGVYRRLVGQALYHEAKAADTTASAQQEKAIADTYHRAAQHLIDAFPDKIDAKKVRESLELLSKDNIARLKPGYPEFFASLQKLGCTKCHNTQNNVPKEKNPATHGAFMLHTNAYYFTDDIKALVSVIDIDNPEKSKLLQKASGQVKHEGASENKLEGTALKELETALDRWLNSFEPAGN